MVQELMCGHRWGFGAVAQGEGWWPGWVALSCLAEFVERTCHGPPSGCLWRGAGYMPASPNSLNPRDGTSPRPPANPAERPEAPARGNWPSPRTQLSHDSHAPDGFSPPQNPTPDGRTPAIDRPSPSSALCQARIRPRDRVPVRGGWGAGQWVWTGLIAAARPRGSGPGAASGSGAGPRGLVNQRPVRLRYMARSKNRRFVLREPPPPGASARTPSSSARRRWPEIGGRRGARAPSTGFSLDPTNPRVDQRPPPTYLPPVGHRRGHCRAAGLGEVVASNNPEL